MVIKCIEAHGVILSKSEQMNCQAYSFTLLIILRLFNQSHM